ncbi:MAG: lamin tail domain-containing protein [Chitinophagaceae bacterium]|nr:lamin tail domain-containing protein [Chitinophagaceae bacterium]
MKKLYFFLAILLAANFASAQLLTEDFNYPAGQLITANGWTAHSAGGTNPITVTTPGLTYAGHANSGIGNAVTMTTSGEDDNRTFTAVTSGTVYGSFLVNLSAVQTAGDYFIGVFQNASTFPVRVYAKSDGAGGFFFGVSKSSSTPVYETTPRILNTTYFIVFKYVFNQGTTTDDEVHLWVNPALGGSETTATIPAVTGTSTDATTIGAFYLRQGSATNAPTQQVDAILAGITWASVTPASSGTNLTATNLADFGTVCVNTTVGPNSFTITGTALTAVPVTVGALTGFTYATTAGGTYTPTLSITQGGGAFTQDIFVKFTPTAAISYNGNIPVGGGGATSINVPATGSGTIVPVLTVPGGATAITQVSATVAGEITATGCTAVTAYGIEYSTMPNFANGSGTPVPSSNLSGGIFSSNLTVLTAGTKYYYHAYATNTGGTGYSIIDSFTTNLAAPTPGMVISQVYGAGGNAAATYTNDFIELFNRSTATIDISGWSVQYASAAGTSWSVGVIPAATTVAAGKYFLIELASGGANGVPLPTPDLTGININMSANPGKVALVNDAVPLSGSGACNTPTVVDVLGYGNTASCSESAPFNPSGITNAKASFRKLTGCTDTNNNSVDFEVLDVAPRNSTTAANNCAPASPTLTATTLTAFGNVCINTTAGPNSFTITGAALTAVPVTVGALAGFTYATVAGGPYTTSLSIPQGGGPFSQQVFVQFTPTAIQSYNGNIAVGGGGATSINVAAAGAGINISVTTGAASAITATSATLAGTATTTCAAITTYGIEYSTMNNFPVGTGLQVFSTNISGGAFTSSVTGLTGGTTYYYRAFANNSVPGTVYGTQMSFVTATPLLSASTLGAFGSVCINTTAGPNSFTITGTNLTNANVNVGALTGFTYSITLGGVYTPTLSLTQPGGSFSQQIFVKFSPTLVQSYNGNIVLTGGGAASVNVPATGAGVNSVPTVTAGAATAITTTSATVPGTIPSIGCSPLTANYGVEYSLTNGFPNGGGTPVLSTNLSGINFSSNLTGLAPNTTYYYHTYASNGAPGTGYSPQLSFTTLSLTPVLNATSLTAFGNVCINTTAGPNSFTVSGSALNATNINVGPLTGFTFSITSGGTYTPSLSLTQGGGTYSQQIFVKFTPTLVQSYNGNIPVNGGGAAAINVAASGAGVNTLPTVTSGAASAITSISATVAGTLPSTGCSPVTTYGIEYSTINGFPNGGGLAVPSTNLAGINFSSNLTALAPTTTYYYHAYAATVSAGTAYGTQGSFTTATPGMTTSAITGFGNVCLNNTAGPNSFTITGTNLTTANVTVGALAGFTYSVASGGTYTATLSIPQPGGAFSQIIYVKFTPTLAQSYNGNIPVGGGGSATVNRSVTGAGINTAATVTSGAASAITQISATVSGTIPSIGCSALIEYGIEYSTLNGFPNGNGLAVLSTNLIGINFSSALTGLAPSTTYYYHAYATNAGGTVYGTQGSFTTSAPVLTATALTGFGAICINTSAGPNSFVISSNAVTAANINVGPLTGFSFSTVSGGPYTASLSLVHPAGAYTQTIYVQFNPTAVQTYNGNIPVNGGGAPVSITVPVTGSGVNTTAAVITGNATINTPTSATLDATVGNIGCSAVTTYGIEYSGISGLANGLGTKMPSGNLSGGNFSATLNGLVQGATYYYKAYAVNNGGISYGVEKTFTMSGIPSGFIIYENPVQRAGNLHYTYKGIKPGHYEIQIFNSIGQLVYERPLIIQVDFIDDNFTLPGALGAGVYSLHIVSPDFRDQKIFMIR